ncbi:hypothetical protein CYY_002229 [Polysphondylium violaceum]|uniref:Uncharacterized protein n=1 Tax=Polysphondylium violaceum TaxID=133409 RepID=A0A8J4Q0H8_9MYCE|nr:hypothetical protein CYY_002229 [Polysphondylium violaceum]
MKEHFQPVLFQDHIDNSLPATWSLIEIEKGKTMGTEAKLHHRNTQNLHNNLHIHHHHHHPLSPNPYSGYSVYNGNSSNNSSHHSHNNLNHNYQNYHNVQMVPMMNPYNNSNNNNPNNNNYFNFNNSQPFHFLQLHSTLSNLSEKLSAQEEKLLMLQSIAKENEEKFKEIENQLCIFTKNINELYEINESMDDRIN